MTKVTPCEDTSENEKCSEVQEKSSMFVFWNRTRIYIMVLSLLCLTLTQMNALTFNFTVICMTDVIEDYHSQNNTEPHWMETSTDRSLLFSGAAIGGLIGLFPSVPIINSLGLKNAQSLSGLLSAIGVFLFPLAVDFSFFAVLICRILQGLGVSILFTTMGVIPGVWAPDKEASTFLAILSCALQLSNIICMPVSGILCESSFTWRSIYYLFGAATFLAHILFFCTYSDSPSLHRNVSRKELRKISAGKMETKKEDVPYAAMFKDPCVVFTWISCVGGNLGFFVLTLYGPTYLREILNFDIRSTGFVTALPFILSAIVKFFAGQLSDRLSFLSEKARFVTFAAASQIGLALGFVVMAITSNRLVAQIAFTMSIVSSGLNIMGVIKCLQFRCRQHVHFAIAVVSFTAYLVQFIAPIAVELICSNHTQSEWSLLFIIVAIAIVVLNAPFPFFSTSQTAPYV